MGVDFLDRRVLAKRVVDGRKPASGHESHLRQGVASGHPRGRSAAKEPQSGLTRRNPLTFDPTCCGFSHSLFAIYARFYAAVNSLRADRASNRSSESNAVALLSSSALAARNSAAGSPGAGASDATLLRSRRRRRHLAVIAKRRTRAASAGWPNSSRIGHRLGLGVVRPFKASPGMGPPLGVGHLPGALPRVGRVRLVPVDE